MFDAAPLALVFGCFALIVFLATLTLGRLLKRHAGVPLGVMYQLLCVALALYVPAIVLDLDWSHPRLDGTGKEIGEWLALRRELLAGLILLGAIFFLALLRRFFWELHFQRRRGIEAPLFLRELIALIVFLTALVVVLSSIYGQTVPGLLAGSGILAVILGFALQDLLGNIISGIAIEIGKPFRPGDWLQVDGQFGRVVEINWRSVRLCTNDEVYLDIPNNVIAKGTVQNLTYPIPRHAIRLHVGLEYHVPPNAAKDVLVRAASRAHHVMAAPPPKAFLKEFADSAIIYEVKFFLEDHARYNDSVDAVHTNIWYELERAGMAIPFPIRTVHLHRPRRANDAQEDARRALRRQEMFANLNDDQLTRLVETARPLHFGRGERIIEQGAEGASMFLLARGEAEVLVAKDGTPAHVATLRDDDCFGEMSLLTGENRSATVLAKTDCRVLELGKAAFGELLAEQPDLMQRFSELLATRQLANEGILSSAVPGEATEHKRRAYAAGFLKRVSKFFEL